MSTIALGSWDAAVNKAKTCAFTALTLYRKSKINWKSKMN